MQVAAVEEEAAVQVVVEVGVGEDEVAVALDEVHADPAPADEHLRDHALRRLPQLDAHGLGVVAEDLESADRRKPFPLPGLPGDGGRLGGSLVVAHHAQGRPWAGHQDPGRAVLSPHGRIAAFGEIDHQGPGDAVGTAGEAECRRAVVEGMLQGGGVVHHSVSHRAEARRIVHDVLWD